MSVPLLTVDSADPLPPFEQIRRQLAALIGSGAIVPGDRLPPLRQLAGDLGLAVGTVGRAYRLLEDAGLVVSRRGAGTRVADGVVRLSAAQRRRALDGAAQAFVWQARSLGASPEQALAALDRAFRAVAPPSEQS